MAKKLTKPVKGKSKTAPKPAAEKKAPKRAKRKGETRARSKARDAITEQGIRSAVDDGLRTDLVRKTAGKIAAFANRIASQRGDMGNEYKEFESKGEHRQAFKDAIKLSKKDADQQNAYLRNFLFYCSALGVGAQLDLFERAATATDASLAGGGQALPLGDEDPKKQAEAFDRGKEAGAKGKKNRTDNPYNETALPKCHAEWARGWDEGQKELLASGLGKSKTKGKADGHAGNGAADPELAQIEAEGAAARAAKQPIGANPHQTRGSPKQRAWERGWLKAEPVLTPNADEETRRAEAFELGDQFARAGRAAVECPFSMPSVEYDRFMAGYNNGQSWKTGQPPTQNGATQHRGNGKGKAGALFHA